MKNIIFFLLISPFISHCQEYVDVLKLGYSYSNKAKFKGIDESTTIKSYNASITFPIELTSKYAFLTGIDFSSNDLLLSPNYNNQLYYTIHYSKLVLQLPTLINGVAPSFYYPKSLPIIQIFLGMILILDFMPLQNLKKIKILNIVLDFMHPRRLLEFLRPL